MKRLKLVMLLSATALMSAVSGCQTLGFDTKTTTEEKTQLFPTDGPSKARENTTDGPSKARGTTTSERRSAVDLYEQPEARMMPSRTAVNPDRINDANADDQLKLLAGELQRDSGRATAQRP